MFGTKTVFNTKRRSSWNISPVICWILLPAIIAVTFFVSALAAGFTAEVLGLWREPVIGFVAAFAVVIMACWMAPKLKFTLSLVVFVIGACLARSWVSSFYPESYPDKAYQPSYIPLGVTYLGGLMGLALCGWLRWRWRRDTDDGTG